MCEDEERIEEEKKKNGARAVWLGNIIYIYSKRPSIYRLP